MKKKSKNLQSFILQHYIRFTVLFILSYLIFLILITIFVNHSEHTRNRELEPFCISDLNNQDFHTMDVSKLLSVGGSLQILDESFHIVYQAGTLNGLQNSYTLPQLMSYLSSNASIDELVRIGSISFDVTFDTIPKIKSDYTLLNQSFHASDGTWYLCLESLPSSYVRQSGIKLMSPENHTIIIISGIVAFIGLLLILLMIMSLFSKKISLRIGKPAKALTKGLQAITSGDYTFTLDYDSENELNGMKDAFNFMSSQLKKNQEEKLYYEKERQMLFSNIAHDLKTPITTIQGYSKALSEGLVTSPEECQEYYDGIYKKSLHLDELLNLLFTYTKLENQAYQLTFETMDIVEYLRKIVAENYKLFETNNMNLEINLPEDEPIYYELDPVEFKRSITNLLINSIKHNPEGTTTYISMEITDKDLIIDIADDGVLISDQLKQNLFEPFVRGDQSRSSKGGNGLGLTICKRIVEKHHGILELLDQKESFTPDDFILDAVKCFRIHLPYHK